MLHQPIPSNEIQRILNLADRDLDYSNQEDNFKDLCKLAAKVAGTDISLINLIDTYTQWTISNHGLAIHQMPREESVCQHTILHNDGFEVPDLADDERFNDKSYVVGEPGLRYYFGIPLQTTEGLNIGALCVLDTQKKQLSPEKKELLKIIADEIVNRLNALHAIELLKGKVTEITETQKRVVHDIRGPLSGIIGLAEIINKQGDANKMDQVLDFIKMIQKSSHSILDLANEILSTNDQVVAKVEAPNASEFNLITLKEKLYTLYELQAQNKNIDFTISINPETAVIPFSKNKLLQIIGNLISNAIKFTPNNGQVIVLLTLVEHEKHNTLNIEVSDMGIGMSTETIDCILTGKSGTTNGTDGELGFGFGLSLVKHLVDRLNGEMTIMSSIDKGSTFKISLPQGK